jgi:pimeloyl-ACP methyl ester carboxylesterase
LIVVGSEDVGGSDHVRQGKVLAERIPGAQYKELAGQSHGYFWEAPDETNAVIRDWVLGHRAG